MPTTLTPVDFTHSVWFIQARTNAAGTAVDDAAGEDFRKLGAIFATGGAVTPNAFKSTLTSGMSFTVGSGTAKKDVVMVPGTASGAPQPYAVSLDQTTVTVTLPASSASNLRRDELYLVVPDPAYPTATVALPRLIVRQGDLGGALPGPDAAWRNYQVIGQYFVGQNATSPVIEQGSTGAVSAKLQSQITAAHAATHGFGGSDPLTALLPRSDTVNVVVADFAAHGTPLAPADSVLYTVTLPTAVGPQNITVSATAHTTFEQNPSVTDARGQAAGFKVVIAGDTTALEQIGSTSISGDTEVHLSAEQTKTLAGVSSFTVRVRGTAGIASGGSFTKTVVKCHVVMPTPVSTNAFTVA